MRHANIVHLYKKAGRNEARSSRSYPADSASGGGGRGVKVSKKTHHQVEKLISSDDQKAEMSAEHVTATIRTKRRGTMNDHAE